MVDIGVSHIEWVRPAVHAAIELGANAFWVTLEHGIQDGVDTQAATLASILQDVDSRKFEALARTLRRAAIGAILDGRCTPEDMRADRLLQMQQWRAATLSSGVPEGARLRVAAGADHASRMPAEAGTTGR